ncbi:MAG: PfaD family polyunsaturated fatty acid/polyketide biosynthesis protein [Pseudomonadota bacterium]
MNENVFSISSRLITPEFKWRGDMHFSNQSLEAIKKLIGSLGTRLYVIQRGKDIELHASGQLVNSDDSHDAAPCLGTIAAYKPEQLGDQNFLSDYGVKYAYYAGAMANGINSEQMVIAMGKKGLLSFFGSGGLSIKRIESAISTIKKELPNGPFAFNLLHNPANPDWEIDCVKLFIKNDIKIVEAAAYINLSPAIVYYRAAGLQQSADGTIIINNKIIAKLSRTEVAQQFLQPASEKILKKLIKLGLITELQAKLASQVPVADDITVEADSGGHTDSGALTCIYPSIVNLRDSIQNQYSYKQQIRIGIAGGIGTPKSVLAAFSMGAAYVVTGSINQSCIESGTSDAVRELLAETNVTDVKLAPSADMFELGANVQVLNRKTMYAVRAQKFYNLYKTYDSIYDIPQADKDNLEKQIFKKSIDDIWTETVEYFNSINLQSQLAVAEKKPKKKMALIFQWYLGQSSTWAIEGVADRLIDYQIWCGPSMGACNEWLSGTDLALPENRSVSDFAFHLMTGAAYLQRIQLIKQLGVHIHPEHEQYKPSYQITVDNHATQEQPAVSKIKIDTNTKGTKTMENNVNSSNKLDIALSKEYYKKCWDLLPGGAHYNFGDPERALIIPFTKGRNSRIWDFDGNEHLDLFCKFGALFVGHHNEEYNDALFKYMHKVTSVDTCDLEYDVCSLLIKHIPCADMVRFCLSGTEAVQNAIRLGRAFSGKNRFIRFHGHYHGNADNIMGGRKKTDLDFPVPEQFPGDMLDTEGRATNILQDQSFVLPWNEIDILEEVILKYKDEIGVVIMEPICINGGGIMPKEGYLERAKELCEEHNIVLIFDEIITGVRLGLGGAQKILGVTPHLATFGKALGGGSLPISLIAGRQDIMDYYTKGKVIHAGTFNGYPLGLAAIKSTYQLVENDPDCYNRMGGHMQKISEIFVRAAKKNDMPLIVQGMPTALVFHSQDTLVDKSEGYSDKVKFCDIIIREISKRYGIQFSPLSRMYPNLLMSDDDVSFFEDRIYDALEKAKRIIDITFRGEKVA